MKLSAKLLVRGRDKLRTCRPTTSACLQPKLDQFWLHSSYSGGLCKNESLWRKKIRGTWCVCGWSEWGTTLCHTTRQEFQSNIYDFHLIDHNIHKQGTKGTPMYKRQADLISFPMPDRRYQYASLSFFSIKNFIWPPDPLNKGKIDFLLQIY